MSLKNKILYYLEKNGYMSLAELEHLCHSEMYKLSNAERRLREIMKTEPIKPVKNSAGAIIAYKWEKPTQETPIRAEQKPSVAVYDLVYSQRQMCCGNMIKGLKEHSKDCILKKAEEDLCKQKLF